MICLTNLPADLKWAITHVSIPDNGASLAQAIIDGKAMSVSDASYKDLFGTAALVVEGPPTSHRANAVNNTPGPIKEGDSTRCETGGLIGIMVPDHGHLHSPQSHNWIHCDCL